MFGYGIEKEEIEKMRKELLGKTIRINYIDDFMNCDYQGRVGQVTSIDDIGQIHGTWGGLAIIPTLDSYEILD